MVDFVELLHTPDGIENGRTALMDVEFLGVVYDTIQAARDHLPASYAELPPAIVDTWLADLAINAVKAVRDGIAGRGEADGVPVTGFAAIIGQRYASNIRRHLPGMGLVASATRASRMVQKPVEATLYGFPVVIDERPEGRSFYIDETAPTSYDEKK